MEFAVKSGRPENLRTGCLVVPVRVDAGSCGVAALDAALRDRVRRLADSGELATGPGKTVLLHDAPGLKAERVLLVATGEDEVIDARTLRKILAGAINGLLATRAKDAMLLTSPLADRGPGHGAVAAEAVAVAAQEAYRFTEYFSTPPEDGAVTVERLLLHTETAYRSQLQRAVRIAAPIAAGVDYARTLGNLPGNVCTPTYLAEEAKALARKHASIRVRIVEEKQMRTLGMGSFLSVTAGSAEPAKLIVIEYSGGKAKAKPRAIVGKGITFDTGGISIKPGPAMDEMKFDMCGAASVLGVMRALPELGLAENVVGLIAAAENMPSGTASRPGDIVKTMSGQTVEILNTDAEGRLVLCDTLTYAERFEPTAVVDIATLTGAAVVALGHHATALFANDDELAQGLLAAGEETGDRAWRMPLWDDYQQQLKSNFADMANVGGREAGSVTAACFLSRFTRNYPWAHLDIAGSAWLSGARKGATGRPVRLLLHWLGARAGD
ncbi:MAG: leucyl aminopeptidase [Pseudomonadales bacterium]|jgi:leucyl aminopeptidase|nr:leucyl aminopeptidase [Pseudomonadales bacterium]